MHSLYGATFCVSRQASSQPLALTQQTPNLPLISAPPSPSICPYSVPPVRSLNPALLPKMSRQDFLGYVSNTRTQFPLGSLLYGKAHAQVYEVRHRQKGHTEMSFIGDSSTH